ncbi:DUF2268 domain-containing putative Zn-dependent protease [uncultured Gulosibacter sp.]|uniref:DUF2268 domain-containing protein n=1 Tax=uncultured Gulosibacter sp. TaxID=1339167 RepID=UPI00288A334A|nr:DUF2268 domain-containing putative Zn-dependent protease [uncultured Gulosibacter sp.]
MTIFMIDSLAGMRRLAKALPGEWDEAARDLWAPMTDMYSFMAGNPDFAQVHAQNFGFGHETPNDVILEALRTLESADAWKRIELALHDGLDRLAAANPSMRMPDLRVLLVLGDPSNTHFMDELRGLSAFGGISGFITITIWPTSEVLNRLEGIALHELHHNVRYSPSGVLWNPQTVTVGEHVVAEGLAELFAVDICGTRGLTHFVSDETRASDEVLERVVEGLDVTGMQDFSAWVLGDASARLFGAQPVGLPTGAGYAAGARIVGEYLRVSGRSAAECATLPAADILAVALPRLGFEAIGH